jgi:hypothetical protein
MFFLFPSIGKLNFNFFHLQLNSVLVEWTKDLDFFLVNKHILGYAETNRWAENKGTNNPSSDSSYQ